MGRLPLVGVHQRTPITKHANALATFATEECLLKSHLGMWNVDELLWQLALHEGLQSDCKILVNQPTIQKY